MTGAATEIANDTGSALAIAQALIRCHSITPADDGALDILQDLLEGAGFACHRLPFAASGTPDVDNLFARIGTGGPHLCFAGHTDVVPPGDEAAWTHPPFAAQVRHGVLYGRGACDMKGGIASFAAAALRYVKERDGAVPGSISFLITGDEEGPAINGTAKVLAWMAANGHAPDHCVIGEPTCPRTLGDMIKIGRRGSLNGALTVVGRQGHVAYPQRANNPVAGLVSVIAAFLAEPLDEGNVNFDPSNLEVTSIETASNAVNVIPASASARFNIRFNSEQTAEDLKDLLRGQAAQALDGTGLDYDLTFASPHADSFVTAPGPLIDLMVASVREVTGRTPALSTSGGTSDARFVKDYCPVVEFGHVNDTIHQRDERVPVADLDALCDIYHDFIRRYFIAFEK